MDKGQKVGSILWVHKDGRTFALSLEENSNIKKSSSLASSSGVIKSPMPGKILKMDLRQGQPIRMGQTLCVIEAMKMEYPLKAPFDGKIKEFFKKAGEQVLLDEKVIVLLKDGNES